MSHRRRPRFARSLKRIATVRGMAVQALLQAKRLEWHRWWKCCPACAAPGVRWIGRAEKRAIPAQCQYGIKNILTRVVRYQRVCRACGYMSDEKRSDPTPPEPPLPDVAAGYYHAVNTTHTSAPLMINDHQGIRRYRVNEAEIATLEAWQDAFIAQSEGACSSLEFHEPEYDPAVDSDNLNSLFPPEEEKLRSVHLLRMGA